jgi:selenocysteine lyase/cysteine desulfurase
MATHEHPGGYGAYRTLEERHGIVIKWIELPVPPKDPEQIVELYRNAITRRTRLLFASHVTYVTGTLMPVRALADLAHSKGLLISVDGAHSAGCLPLNMGDLKCDHYAAAGQKWLMAGSGTGFCYIPRAMQPRIWPLMGWTEPEEKDRHTSRRYEVTGQRNIPSIIAMGAAVAVQDALGRDNIEARVRMLGQRLRLGLSEIPGVKVFTSLDPVLNAGITTFAIAGSGLTGENLAGTLALRHGFRVSKQIEDKGPTKGWNSVRICTHIFVMPDEVDFVLATVRDMVADPARYRDVKRPDEA